MNRLTAADSQILNSELSSGEKLLWNGHPDAGRACRAALPIFLFAIPWTAFAVFWVVMAAGGIWHGGKASGPLFVFPLFGLPFILVGLGLLSTPFFAYQKAKNTHYGVTNRRILVVTSGKIKSVQQYEYSTLSNLTRTEYGTRGDLVWTVPTTMPVAVGNTAYSRSAAINSSVSFIGIERPKDVERLVEDQIKKDEQARKNPNGDANVQH
ncbi:MAG: hypothetical protein KGS72_11565 [Cyanobacteria bacterium REEB67]|nr:hypothetical protein [Cyanobacteria bacterium REEB67]